MGVTCMHVCVLLRNPWYDRGMCTFEQNDDMPVLHNLAYILGIEISLIPQY